MLANIAALGGGRVEFQVQQAQTADHHGTAAIALLQSLPAAANASPAVTPAVGESSKSPEPRCVGLSISPLMLKQMEDEVVEEAEPLGLEQHRKQSIRQRPAARSSQDCRRVEDSPKVQGCLSDGQNSV